MSTATAPRRSDPTPRAPRSRRIVIAVVVALACVAGGLAWLGGRQPSTGDHGSDVASTPTEAPPVDAAALAQDALAAATMPTLDPAAALPHPLDPGADSPPLTLPASTTTVAGVDAGFTRTPEGAVAQLAAIDAAALDGMNLAQVENVYDAFATPGSGPVEAWSTYRFAAQTLASGGVTGGSSQISATYSVSEAQIKGTLDGGDFVIACVNGEFDIWLSDELTRIGAADCARMVWSGFGWRIGPGTQPAEPPNAWPGTVDAARVGWRPIDHVC